MSSLVQYRLEVLGCDSICFVPIEQKTTDRKAQALDISKFSLNRLNIESNKENEKTKLN